MEAAQAVLVQNDVVSFGRQAKPQMPGSVHGLGGAMPIESPNLANGERRTGGYPDAGLPQKGGGARFPTALSLRETGCRHIYAVG